MVTKSTGDKFELGTGIRRTVYNVVQDIEKDSPAVPLAAPEKTENGQLVHYANSPQELRSA